MAKGEQKNVVNMQHLMEFDPQDKQLEIAANILILSLNARQTFCRMLQWEHSAILSTFIKLQFVIKNFVLSIFSGSLIHV